MSGAAFCSATHTVSSFPFPSSHSPPLLLFQCAHEYFTYLHPHRLFSLTNFQTVRICISHGSLLGRYRDAPGWQLPWRPVEDYNEGTTWRSGCADPACRAAILQRSVNPESQPRGMNQKNYAPQRISQLERQIHFCNISSFYLKASTWKPLP